jgi:hypothetical protein
MGRMSSKVEHGYASGANSVAGRRISHLADDDLHR